MSFGLTPLEVIVIVVVAIGVVEGEAGDELEDDPPHAAAITVSTAARPVRSREQRIWTNKPVKPPIRILP